MHIEITECRLRLGRPLSPGEATRLRGHFAAALPDETLAHQHLPGGGLRYDYPLVQFKVIDREALLVGVGEGGAVVARAWAGADAVSLAGEELPVLESTLSRRRAEVGPCESPVEYRFAAPWLGLNQANHARYADSDAAGKRDVLARALVGNCLSLSKSLGLWVDARLEAEVGGLRERACHFKGVPMVGFTGRFRVNFRVPAGLGVGKSVSRGFGTVEPLAAEARVAC